MKTSEFPKLSSSAQKIQEALNNAGFSCEVVEFTESTRTAQEAADKVGCELGQIVKSLIFKGTISNKPVLVLASGVNRVNEELISNYANEKIARADAEYVRSVTGFVIGGVPPIAHQAPMETYIDEDLYLHETIWAAAGTPKAVFLLRPQELEKMTKGKVCPIK